MQLFVCLLLITIVGAKCGLWYQFSHSREGPFRENRYGNGGSPYADTKWAAGYESLDQQIMCNDEEMFQQCHRAQYILDAFASKNNLPLATIGCADNIVCSPTLPGNNGKFYCQNMDAYDLCLQAQLFIENLNQTAQYPIRCVYASMLSDNIPVINYRRSEPTTTIVPTVPANTTLTPTTTSPSLASLNLVSVLLLLLVLL